MFFDGTEETNSSASTTQNKHQQESLALASMARDDPPASSGKVGSEFET